ncbi:NorM family multidrug efflux MATE transporter [Pseudomonas sp. N040]|uniref:NorM family multidrug efflux MATE transporter n=1 Tax=Pseudomonas sp. N040 TaxID=2785325 RepID=UPI0018A30480|nr:NorM family multidrug efflux MATE transporter [Pseudomonas sp. N040]MBF7728702.1 NorM family multidrug efflux MATE transporter [Pseudomonas sp. N040]MBW7012342.1 NorM family multidrug efflux MATE transporter [Pseudomonas sp. N040]
MPELRRRELVALLRLAGPLVAAQLAAVLMVFTDTVMMGLLGPQALAAGALGAAAYNLVSIFCVGVMAAVGNLVAIRHGAADNAGVRAMAQAGIWVALGLALLAGLLLWQFEPLLRLAGQQPQNIEGAMQFLHCLVFALPGYLLFMALRGFTSALGKPGPVLAISLCGAVLNFLLNYTLIKGLFGLPQIGLAGIGLVTAVVMNGMALLLALFIRRQPFYRPWPLLAGLLQPRLEDLRENLRLGLPIGGTYIVESGLFFVAALCMGALGSTALAAHQIAIQAVYVAFMVPVGISYAASLRIGQHFGAGNWLAARQTGRLAIGLGAVCMSGFALLFWLAPHWVIVLFLDPQLAANRPVIDMAIGLLAIAAWFELFDGLQTIAMGTIRGLKDAKTTLLVGLLCYWAIGAPAAWTLAFIADWGPTGVWWGLAVGLACAALGLILAFEWKTTRLLAAMPIQAPTARVPAAGG